ncbi:MULTISPECIES: hypothetical protein [unclassified Janthinobacterium]|uniref:hypothetical protein n=1 Tax=unclassified Janthinobacterium TaxID=2610881 RepID=UPI000349CB53|nr:MULTISPECIES: hypothetical protein [unclassified Janthinobacterium]MEC5162698.1 hypothetical protein [Janthinobacterium sp. CG_S6]
MKKTVVLALAGVVFISGCAAPNGGGGMGGGHSAGQNTAAGAAVGAVAGCALAAALGKRCAEGAAIGALVGAAIGWSSSSEKVASAQTVNAQARREGVAVPDDEIRLRDYQLNPSSRVAQAGGAPLQVVGDIKLIGQSRRVPEVVQSMTLVKANGENASDKPQIARVEKVDGAGQYKAIGIYKIPRGMEQGQYTVRSVLFLDGREVARRDTGFRVARLDGAAVLVASR